MANPENAVKIERKVYEPWAATAANARTMREMLLRAPAPRTESHFDQVDKLVPGYMASQWCRSYISAALEHLTMWADYAVPEVFHPDQVVVHTLRPVLALTRAASESAAQAVWIMAASDSKTAVVRHLRLVAQDLDELRKASTGAQRTQAKADLDQLLEEYGEHGDVREISTAPTYRDLIRGASATVIAAGPMDGFPKSQDEAERIWRGSAGAMHGKLWPSRVLAVEMANPGATAIRVPDPHAIEEALGLADGFVSLAVLRFLEWLGYEGEILSRMDEAFAETLRTAPLLDGVPRELAAFRDHARKSPEGLQADLD